VLTKTQARPAFTGANTGDEARQRIQAQIAEHGLERNVADLEALGYTVVEHAAPLDLFDRISEAIVEVTEEVQSRGVKPFNFGPNTSMVYRLLGKSPAFAEAVLTPKLTTLMTYLLGEAYVATVATGSILGEGAKAGPLHADNQFFPDPFPVQVHVATAIWCCDDFNAELGSTHVVPGSNRQFRHPRAGEGVDQAVPIEAPRGSIVIWTGHTWHRSGARTAPGQRIALHTGFARPHVRSFEAYEPSEVEALAALDPRLAELVGATLPFAYGGDGPDPRKLVHLGMRTQAQA
jgi:ectoine hydroxylase-related dioxygenase (phytanoyl-CoA dioxygenase family)